MSSAAASFDGDPATHGADSAGCLFLVGCYADLARTLSPLVVEAASRIMRSPSLSDFIELRFADIGPRPKRAAERGAAVERIALEFARPRGGAGRNYFAVLIADRSASAVEQVLADCGADPIIGILPMRRRGIATEDDRRPECLPRNPLPAAREGVPAGSEQILKEGGGGSDTGDADSSPVAAADVVVLKAGSWGPEDLIAELRRYAEDLLHDFATTSEPGLTCEQLADLLPPNQVLPLEAEHAGDLQPGTARPPDGASTVRDKPSRQAEQRSKTPTERGSQLEFGKRPAWRWSPAALLKRRGHPADHVEPEAASTGTVPAGTVLAKTKAAGTARTGTASAGTVPVQAGLPVDIGEVGRALPAALLLLVLSGDEASRDRDAWRRRMAVLLDVDKKVAMISRAAYRVRALPNVHNLEDAARYQLRRAGQLSRRDLKRTGDSYDFTRMLRVVMEVLPRDLAVLGRSSPRVERPVVVICAVNVPLADGVTAQMYGELVRQASIIWVVPEQSVDLMSPLFTAGDTRRLIYHSAVADEVVDLLRQEATGPG